MASAAATSAWGPLRRRGFRALWIAQFAANTGTWVQTVGAQWLMGDLGGRAFQIALVQTAMTLPVFLLVVPAGALGDIMDRRKLLLAGQSLMVVGAAGLTVLTAAGAVTQTWLLGLIALMGVGQALSVPCFQAIQPELVSRREIPQAALLNGANANVARAVGPALGGLLIAAIGPEATFGLNALSFSGVLLVLFVWQRVPTDRPLGAEHVRTALLAGARYVRSAPRFATVLARSLLFMIFASALWALLPVLARGPLELGPGGYGVLLASIGLGAVYGAVAVPAARRRFGPNHLVTGATLVYAAAMGIIAVVHSVPVAIVSLFAVGVAWIAVQSTLNASAQTLLPDWTRARALAYFQFVFMGGQALGAVVWGAVADEAGLDAALLLPAAGLAVSMVLAVTHLRLEPVELDVTWSRHWPEPHTVEELPDEAGPVLVTVEWTIDPDEAAAFVEVMKPVGKARRRTGATQWGLFRDLADSSLYVETFIVPTWEEHMRQHHERGTVMDAEADARAAEFLMPGTELRVQHLLWAPAALKAAEHAASEAARTG
jgi:MFS family permease